MSKAPRHQGPQLRLCCGLLTSCPMQKDSARSLRKTLVGCSPRCRCPHICVGGRTNRPCEPPNGYKRSSSKTSRAYVAINGSNIVSVIDTATNTVVGSPIAVGSSPVALGLFIQPELAIKFAGTPGKANCRGQSVSALARQYHGLNGAAAALGLQALQDAI